MSIIVDFKNAVRDALYKQDNTLNFYFHKIEVATFPYCFLYFSDAVTFSKALSKEYYREFNFPCVIEYMKSANNDYSELYNFADTLAEALQCFPIYDTKVEARNINFKVVEDVLQMTFDIVLFAKMEDDTELMKDLDFTIKGV